MDTVGYSFIAFAILFVIFVAWFYRDPSAFYDWDDNAVVAPSYGTVVEINDLPDHYHVISFLSPTDVHRQYIPVNGALKLQEYDRSGNFHLAYKLCKSDMNEKMVHIFETAWGDVTVTQIAGFLTRRIVSFVDLDDGSINVQAGQPLGLIKLGSRVDIRIPKPCFLDIEVGDTLSGGRQAIARMYSTV